MRIEFAYLSKEVYYTSENKMMNDGLTEYLQLFNIDDNYDQHIKLDVNRFEEVLFLNKDDIILTFLE